MIIRTVKTENPYAQIDKRLLNNKELSWRTKGILAYLLSKPNDWETRISDIIQHAKEGRTAVDRCLKEAKEKGYILEKEIRNEKGQYMGIEYDVYETPQAQKPAFGKPEFGEHTPTNNKEDTNNEKDMHIKIPLKTEQLTDNGKYGAEIQEITSFLNKTMKAKFLPKSQAAQKLIRGRLNEGHSVADFEMVIEFKCLQWKNDGDMSQYLRPKTLFASSNFGGYLEDARRNLERLKDEGEIL